MPPPFRHRTTKKEPRRSPRPAAAALEERTEEIMDRVHQAGDNQVERVAALEEYLILARAHEGATWFDAGTWSEDLASRHRARFRSCRRRSDTARSSQVPALTFTPARNRAYPVEVRSGVNDVP
jgi:hypothetical protein